VIKEQERTAHRMYVRGIRPEEIAEKLGISLATAGRRIKAGRESRGCDDIDQLRADAGSQLEEVTRSAFIEHAAATDPKIRLAALGTVLKANAEHRRLYAVDSPTPLEESLIARADLESELVATTLLNVIGPVMDAVAMAVDVGYADRLRAFTMERMARALIRIDGSEPDGPEPEPPKPQIAIGPGLTSESLGDDGATDHPHPRHRDAAHGILAQAWAALAEDDDEDGDDEDDAEDPEGSED